MIFIWDTRKFLQDIILNLFVVNKNTKKIEDLYKYKYIIDLPFYGSKYIYVTLWWKWYLIRYIKNDIELNNFKKKFWDNYIFWNIIVLKNYNNDITDWAWFKYNLVKNWVFKLNKISNQIEMTEKAKNYLLTKNEIKNLLQWKY